MNYLETPQEIKSRLASLAQNHEGSSAVDMFNAIPENLRDSASEINQWIDTHEWSHIIPKSMGGVEAVWETKAGHPNQVRGDVPMTLEERMHIEEQNYIDAIKIDGQHEDDKLAHESFDDHARNHIGEWSESLNQALMGAGLAGVSGYAVAFAFRVARNVISHKSELIKNREFRKSFLIKTLEQANHQGIRGGALAFLVAFICIVFPPFKFLLLTGAIVGLGRLGLELLHSVAKQVDPAGTSALSRLFDFSISAFNIAASVLSVIWAALNTVVDWIIEGLKAIADSVVKVGRHIFRSISRMMDWLLGIPSIVCKY